MSGTHKPSQPFASPEHFQRLGQNIAGYSGQVIDIKGVLAGCQVASRKHGWLTEEIHSTPEFGLLAFVRRAAGATHRVYLSAGIHGDEPAGPLAVQALLHQDRWPGNPEIWICPCLNPAGFRLNRREHPEGVDLNRQYRQPKVQAIESHIKWLRSQPPFDICLCLHEDWESNGFYVYELNRGPCAPLSEAIIGAAASHCPIDHADTIDGRPAHGGIIRPVGDLSARPDWPEAFFLLAEKSAEVYTLEAPSDYELPIRAAGLVAGVRGALAALAERTAG